MNTFKRISEGIRQTSQPSTGSGTSLQSTEALRESFSQPSTISGSPVARADNRVGHIDRNIGTNMFNQVQPQGGVLGAQGIQPYNSGYAVQGSAQSMNVNPMLNNSIGSLGQNNTGGIGLSSGLGNMSTTQKYNGLGNIGYNAQGNNYNIIGGVELV